MDSYENVPDFSSVQFSSSLNELEAQHSHPPFWVNCPFSRHAVYHPIVFTVIKGRCCLTIHFIGLTEARAVSVNILAHFRFALHHRQTLARDKKITSNNTLISSSGR